mmetsp:Transcript_26083/g.33395  ORF Transcript_26083/g.33395 Transcript_26083/m.33395 type:complete len:92 (-) Transcript_26083:763-1038(-)
MRFFFFFFLLVVDEDGDAFFVADDFGEVVGKLWTMVGFDSGGTGNGGCPEERRVLLFVGESFKGGTGFRVENCSATLSQSSLPASGIWYSS